uniref:Uncharacterized protein n=1 Tax=Lepeophtheirus salmonis TaxID=72036 RepID=A0A0K2U8B6_LEPSM
MQELKPRIGCQTSFTKNCNLSLEDPLYLTGRITAPFVGTTPPPKTSMNPAFKRSTDLCTKKLGRMFTLASRFSKNLILLPSTLSLANARSSLVLVIPVETLS